VPVELGALASVAGEADPGPGWRGRRHVRRPPGLRLPAAAHDRTLLQVAETEAVEHIVGAQLAELDALGTDATLHDIAAPYFRPVVQALSGPDDVGRSYLGVLVRLAANPPRELHEWAAATIQRAHDRLHKSLRAVLPDVPDAELRFRVKCVGGIIVELGGWGLKPDLQGKTPQQVEGLLVPVVAEALTGG
jgi:hypothetical protein